MSLICFIFFFHRNVELFALRAVVRDLVVIEVPGSWVTAMSIFRVRHLLHHHHHPLLPPPNLDQRKRTNMFPLQDRTPWPPWMKPWPCLQGSSSTISTSDNKNNIHWHTAKRDWLMAGKCNQIPLRDARWQRPIFYFSRVRYLFDKRFL